MAARSADRRKYRSAVLRLLEVVPDPRDINVPTAEDGAKVHPNVAKWINAKVHGQIVYIPTYEDGTEGQVGWNPDWQRLYTLERQYNWHQYYAPIVLTDMPIVVEGAYDRWNRQEQERAAKANPNIHNI